jgi:hypothetical protein
MSAITARLVTARNFDFPRFHRAGGAEEGGSVEFFSECPAGSASRIVYMMTEN